MSSAIRLYLFNVLVAIDQLVNTLAGGDPDETISSRAAKRRASCRFCRALCRLLDRVDPGHCNKSIEPDEGRNATRQGR